MRFQYFNKLIPPFLRLLAKIKVNESVISIFDALKDARDILVFMPEKPEDFKIAHEYLRILQESFPESRLHVVMRELYGKLSHNTNLYGMIFVDDENENIFGLPKRGLVAKIEASTYDIAIDLNHDFHLLSTYLCQKSGARLRICLTNKNRDPFCNINFRFSLGSELAEKYDGLFKLLIPDVKVLMANH